MDHNEPTPERGWICPYLTVRDVEAAVAFYERALGFEKLCVIDGPNGLPVHAEMRHKGAIFMVGTHPDQTTGSKSPVNMGGTSVRFYFYTEDVDALVHRAQAAGAILLESPADQYWGDRTASVRDPEGHVWWMAARLRSIAHKTP